MAAWLANVSPMRSASSVEAPGPWALQPARSTHPGRHPRRTTGSTPCWPRDLPDAARQLRPAWLGGQVVHPDGQVLVHGVHEVGAVGLALQIPRQVGQSLGQVVLAGTAGGSLRRGLTAAVGKLGPVHAHAGTVTQPRGPRTARSEAAPRAGCSTREA